jgi:hydroxyacylglutathione hydrolase
MELSLNMSEFQTFIGGIFDTNAYLIKARGGEILFDAPTGTLDWLERENITPSLLLLTHGHIDHIDDAAKIKRRFGCQVGCHADSVPLISDPDFFKQFGFFLEAEPVEPDFLISEGRSQDFLSSTFDVLLVPGHCPGSLCFFSSEQNLLVGGDVLFAGSIGRTDLPGGNHSELLENISKKVLVLPDETRVLSGHGPETTIGEEKRHNPFLR